MIKQCEKIKSEIYFYFDGVSVDNATGEIDISCYICNYFGTAAKLKTFRYSINGTNYFTGTLAATQTEPDLDEIPLNHKQRKLYIIWDALTDLGAAGAESGVWIELTFIDYLESGVDSEIKKYNIPETIDFSPETEINFIRPYPVEDKFDFNFKNVLCITTKQVHYKIEVSEYKAFTIGETDVYESSVSQVGWSYDGGSFPVGGCNTDTSNPKTITFTNAALNNLSEDKYFIRVTRIVQ